MSRILSPLQRLAGWLAGAGAAALLALASPAAHALALSPGDDKISCRDNETSAAMELQDTEACFGVDPLVLAYKANQDGEPDEGTHADSYDTEFLNTPDDPMDATISFVGGDALDCDGTLSCFLVVKDGNAEPARYFFNITGWNGTESIFLTDFWPGTGAISHVSIYTGEGGDPPEEIPEPSSLALIGLALAGLGLMRRRRA